MAGIRHDLLAVTFAVLVLTACGPLAQRSALTTTTVTSVPSSSQPPGSATPRTSSARAAPARPGSSSATPVAHTSVVAHAAAAPVVTSGTSATAGTGATAGTVGVRVYFTEGARLVPETRMVPSSSAVRASLEALLAGAAQSGHYSQVPTGTRLKALQVEAGMATVDLTEQVEKVQGSPAIPLLLGQLVDTLTQFPSVQRVRLEVNGRPVRSLGGEGYAVPEPLDHAAVQRLLGPG